jgi:Endodeoxyribonuclease RusA.
MTLSFSVRSGDVYFPEDRKSLFLVLRGCPCAKPAPRLANPPGRNAFMYNPVQKEKTMVQSVLRNALGLNVGELFFAKGSMLRVEMLHFMFPRPQYHFKRNKERDFENVKAKYQSKSLPVDKKPDIDNLEKFLFDAFEGVVFDDDRHIFGVHDIAKYYDSEEDCRGQTIISIKLLSKINQE